MRGSRFTVSATPLHSVAIMAASASAPNELAQLLLKVVTTLPPDTHVLVLRHLPMPELARLSCVHKAFHVAWRSLQKQQPGERFSPPAADNPWRTSQVDRLSRAVFFGDVAIIRSIVAAGVDEHGTPLLQAVKYRECVMDVALYNAAGRGHLQAVELLCAAGGNLHACDDQALKSAATHGHTDVVQLLLERGANVHADGDYALRWASENGHIGVVQLLIQNGADAHVLHYALRAASQSGNADMIRLLVRAAFGTNNDAELMLESASGNLEVVLLLIEDGADVKAVDDLPLLLASANGHAAVVQLLLQHGADVNTHLGWWCLQEASKSGHVAVVQLLLQHGADVHARDDEALRWASEGGHAGIVVSPPPSARRRCAC